MRIGMIAPTFPPALGGMQELAANLARELAATDDLVVMTRAGNSSGCSSYRLECTLTGQFDRDAQSIRDMDDKVEIWLGMQASTCLFTKYTRRPFIVYCYGNDFLNPWEPYPLATWLGQRLSGLPFWWRYANAVQASLRRARIRPGFRGIRQAIAISEETARLLSETMGLARTKIAVIPPGVADDYFQPHAVGGGARLRILTVSRLPESSRKNVDGVLRAISTLADLPVSYTVVGDGPGRLALESLARELGIADRVRFLGSVSRQVLMSEYQDADVFVLAPKATRTDIEGFGIVYLEASASGVPVLASRRGGAMDAVHEGQNGMLLDGSEPEDIARGIHAFWHRRREFVSDRVRAVSELYRWPVIAGRVRRVLLAHTNTTNRSTIS